MHTRLNEVFNEAVNDYASTNLDGDEYDAMMYYGIKIVRNHSDDSIQIFNTARGGDYYKEIKEEEYTIFFEEGWTIGVRKMALAKYKERLDNIEKKMKDEINGRNNAKYISFLKETRKSTLNKYYNVTQKLNKNVKST